MDCQNALIELRKYRAHLQMALRYEVLLKNEQKTDAPRVLFHYTSAEGLKGIIESGKIWATSSYHVNDSSEYRYGFQLAESVLNLETNHRTLAEMVRRSLNNHYGLLNFYLTCFCDSANDLSMWRFYGLQGYSLGFNFSDLVSRLAVQPVAPVAWTRSNLRPGLSLVRVIYDEETQLDLIQKLINKASELEVSDGLESFTAGIALVISECISAFKNPAFSAEREWRLVQTLPIGTDGKDAHMRVKNEKLIPYIELDVLQQPSGLLPLHSIHLGPAVDRVGGERAIRLLLDKYRYPEVRIEGCSHPIRPM
jgi:Protein of unknown function (DUF2971)